MPSLSPSVRLGAEAGVLGGLALKDTKIKIKNRTEGEGHIKGGAGIMSVWNR